MPPKKNAIVPSHATGQEKTARFGRQPRAITERNQAIDAVEGGEDKFKYMFDHSSVGNSITLPSGEINVNHTLCEMLGFSQAELNNCKWQEITHPDDVELTQNEMDALISGKKETARFIKRYINKAGSVVWADVGSTLRRDKDGRPLYFISTIMDITEHQQAERELIQSHARYQQLFENSGTGMIIVDENGRYIMANKVTAQKFGTTPDQVVGKSMFDFLQPEQAGHYLVLNRQLLLSGGHREYEDTFKLPTGEHTFLIIDQCLQDEQSRNFAVQSISIDITERSQASEALHKSEERLREVLENSLDASYKRDLKTNRYEYLSPVFTRLSGYGPEVMKILSLESILELIHPDDLPEVNRQLAEALSGPPGTNWQVEYRFKHKRGQYCWFQDRFTIMCDGSGQPVALIGSVSDVNDRKEAEEALLQKMDELERFQHLTVGRELRMIEMKKEINAMLAQSGHPAQYTLPPES